MNVQAFINNISFPKTIEELKYFVIYIGNYNVEDVLYNDEVEWTIPKWAMRNDIVFFFHAKTALQTIRKLEILIAKNRETENATILLDGLQHARKLYTLYGGKIFAIGKVLGSPYHIEHERNEELHWKGKIYAEIGEIVVLKNPIDISEFSDFIMVSRQSAITPVLGDDFYRLKEIIKSKNIIPNYLSNSKANPMPFNKINSQNWLIVTKKHRRAFFQEIQFRKFYVDYFLKMISDKKTIFSECACYKDNKLSGYVDNCIWLNNRWVFVEVKINFDAERNLKEQLKKYTYVLKVILSKGRCCYENIEQEKIIIIDVNAIGIFNARTDNILYVEDLDYIKTEADLNRIKYKIIRLLEN